MSTPLSSTEINILVVEDNPIDVRMIKWALKAGGFTKEPTVVDDGLPALALLRREKEYEHHPSPDLVILDLNLKQIDGPEVLTCIRQTTGLSDMCVAILSSSPKEVMVSRAAQANGYFTKPDNLMGFRMLDQQIMDCYCRCSSNLQ